jgi:glycosyltransferase involved in cell wall biosynthesis
VRILYHHRTLADGAEGIHIAAMVEAFSALGHEVLALGVPPHEHVSSRRGMAQAVRDILPQAVFEVSSIALNGFDYLDVRRQIRRFRPNLLYKRHAKLDIGALAAAAHAGIPSVLEVNSLFTQGAYHEHEPIVLGQLALRFENRALALAKVVVAVSTPLARQTEMLGCRHAVVLPNGVNPATFNPRSADPARIRARHGLTPAVTIGWSGILREWHGLGTLLEAAAGVPGTQLLIVGDGPARADLERRVAALGMGARVTITGRVAHTEMPDYLAAMDVAVVADDRTGVASPMKLLEYMAMERAVVAPQLDNIRDLITDGINGLLFTAGDTAALHAVLRRLAADASLRDVLGQNARRAVERERTWRRNAERVISLVTEARDDNRNVIFTS